MLMIECYQKLSIWLCSSSNRANRTYLEAHLDLLEGDIERFLELFIAEHSNSPAEQQHLRTMQALLQDTRLRGGTQQAVRDAYVNVFGGLILDLPSGLCELERRLALVSSPLWTERMVAVCKMQLRDAINYASTASQVAPEIGVELQYQLARLFANKSAHAPANVYDMVVDSYHACLPVYTAERYPRQYHKVQAALAEVSGGFS